MDNTRGFLAGVLMEREISYGLRLEFNTKSVRNTNEALFEFDHSSNKNRAIGTLNSKLLIPEKEVEADADPLRDAMKMKFKKYFTTFIFAHDTLHPKEVYQAIQNYLQPSASFAIFSQVLQPLTELEQFLDFNLAVNVRIEELLTREYQVLPLRTHPTMTTDGRSGYILSG